MFIFLFIIQFFYFFIDFFINGLFVHYGYSLGGGILVLGILLIHGIILVALIFLYIGMTQKAKWARKFTIFYLVWASLWALWGLLVANNIVVNLILLIIYMMMIFYFTTEEAQEFFQRFFQYGKYILYTRMVQLKSGLQLPIYFFSSHHPKSGHPTDLPEKYTVKENPRSQMPYLKKKETNQAKQKQETPVKTRVIYVVNNASHETRQGPWTVRTKQKTISNHKTKQMAIKKARLLAKKQQGRVLVQNTDGRFSYGFKPKQPRST